MEVWLSLTSIFTVVTNLPETILWLSQKLRRINSIKLNCAHSVLQGISPTLKYLPHPFLSSPPPKKNSKSVRPPTLLRATPFKILENLTPPPLWNVPSSKKAKTLFKEQKILFPIRIHLNIEIWIYSCKIKKSKES